ncbi:unnamed protein product [Mycena citricolor]|uniref:Uncharacterized protein n=1 Tax=Mycena citricolor TaxID=2018698 RepID=A0AAD2JTZ8_9AGAR|nr:unnamed protein product [Mycena citricolor]
MSNTRRGAGKSLKGLAKQSKVHYGRPGLSNLTSKSSSATVPLNKTASQRAEAKRLYHQQLEGLSYVQREDIVGSGPEIEDVDMIDATTASLSADWEDWEDSGVLYQTLPPGEEGSLHSHAGGERLWHGMMDNMRSGRGDSRIRSDRILRQNESWNAQMPQLADAYLHFKANDTGNTDSEAIRGGWPLRGLGLEAEVDLFKDEVRNSERAHNGSLRAGSDVSIPDADHSGSVTSDTAPGAFKSNLNGADRDEVAWLNVNELEESDAQKLEQSISVGELMKYPLALVSYLLDTYGANIGLGYDIMCAFFKTLLRSSLGAKAVAMGLSGIVPAFHGHAHNRECQLGWHPMYHEGVGLEDFEECERTFCQSNQLASSTRLATPFHRQQQIDEHFFFHDLDKNASIGSFIFQNYRQAIEKIAANTVQLRILEDELQTNASDYEQDLKDELTHLQGLKHESEEMIQLIDYMELLGKLSKAKDASVSAAADYHNLDRLIIENGIKAPRIASIRARYRTSHTHHLLVEEEVARFEVEKGIEKRWDQSSPEYKQTLRYKLRDKISKALRSRADAIQRALSDLNAAGARLTPARKPIAWADIVHTASLAEFDLLRETRADIRNLPWTQPLRREAASLYFGIKRAEEEIIRLNVEIKRVITAMLDEHVDLYRAITSHLVVQPNLARELSRQSTSPVNCFGFSPTFMSTANIHLPPPPTRDGVPESIPSLHASTLTPLGVHNVRRYMLSCPLTPNVFSRLESRFKASDMAFICAGASSDGQHRINPNRFHPEFLELYDSLPTGAPGQTARREFSGDLMNLLFDVATKWDRCTGGTTFVFHVAGTTIPGLPVVPERLKADVYIPPHFLAENPGAHADIAFLVQTFLERVGVPTVNSWRRRAVQMWSLSQQGHIPPISLPTALIPNPVTQRSSSYTFRGRPANSLMLTAMVSSSSASGTPLSPGLSTPRVPVWDIDELTYPVVIKEQQEEIEEKTGLIGALTARIDDLQEIIDALRESINQVEDEAQRQRAEITVLCSQVEALSAEVIRLGGSAGCDPASTCPPAYTSLSEASSALPHGPPSHTPSRSMPSQSRLPPRIRAAAPISTHGRFLATDSRPLPRVNIVLQQHDLMHLREAVGFVAELAEPASWSTYLQRLHLSEAVLAQLLDALDHDI